MAPLAAGPAPSHAKRRTLWDRIRCADTAPASPRSAPSPPPPIRAVQQGGTILRNARRLKGRRWTSANKQQHHGQPKHGLQCALRPKAPQPCQPRPPRQNGKNNKENNPITITKTSYLIKSNLEQKSNHWSILLK